MGVEREAKKRRAVEVKVKSQEKALEVTFDDGTRFRYPAEFLRVFSPSAEVKGHMPGQEKVSLSASLLSQLNLLLNQRFCFSHYS